MDVLTLYDLKMLLLPDLPMSRSYHTFLCTIHHFRSKMRSLILSTLTAALLALCAADADALSERDDIAGGTELRILPLGDSITVGVQSSDGNGYRVGLEKNLARSKLQFVGDLRNGSMLDDYNAGT